MSPDGSVSVCVLSVCYRTKPKETSCYLHNNSFFKLVPEFSSVSQRTEKKKSCNIKRDIQKCWGVRQRVGGFLYLTLRGK